VPGLATPPVPPDVDHAYHQYTVRVAGGRRDGVTEVLASKGIGTMVYYPVPCHRLPVYASEPKDLPETDGAAGEVLSLPMGPGIEESDQDRVVAVLIESLR